jgi:outer membrane protein assembly factor BamA
VGQIIILGNTQTSTETILKQVPLRPGQVLNYADVQTAERNLARLGRFVVRPDQGVAPRVTVVDSEGQGGFKDVVIQVEEK